VVGCQPFKAVAPAALDRTQPKSPPATYVAPAGPSRTECGRLVHGPTSFSSWFYSQAWIFGLRALDLSALANTVLTPSARP